MNLTFYNNYHNGDIFVSRNYVRDIISKTEYDKYYYYHKNPFKLLKDLSLIQINARINTDSKLWYKENQDIFINTWFNPNTEAFKKYDCSFKTLYENFEIIYNILNIKLENYNYYIPKIDFDKFEIYNVDRYLIEIKNKYKKIIFVSNGVTQSGQSVNFNFDPIIDYLSNKFTNYLFIMTNDTSLIKNNIVKSKDIINIQNCDLNENSYLSTKCDVIIGRASGTYTFALNSENILNDKKQIFINVTSLPDFYFGVKECINENKIVYGITNFDIEYIKEYVEKIIL